MADLEKLILKDLFYAAAGLASEDGENNDYDEEMAKLIASVSGSEDISLDQLLDAAAKMDTDRGIAALIAEVSGEPSLGLSERADEVESEIAERRKGS